MDLGGWENQIGGDRWRVAVLLGLYDGGLDYWLKQ